VESFEDTRLKKARSALLKRAGTVVMGTMKTMRPALIARIGGDKELISRVDSARTSGWYT